MQKFESSTCRENYRTNLNTLAGCNIERRTAALFEGCVWTALCHKETGQSAIQLHYS